MEVRLLGELECVADDESALPIRGVKARTLLAVLALHRGEPVAPDRLMDILWGEFPPGNPVNALQALVRTLRLAIGAANLTTADAGYALGISADDLDVVRFERLVADGRRHLEAGDAALASDVLREALALCRDEPLVEFAYAEFAAGERARLQELLLAAVEARIEADLALGRHAELVGELEALCEQHSLRERLWELRMLALYRSGRQADALCVYADARERLVEAFGLEPGPRLRELEARVLAQDPALDLPGARGVGLAPSQADNLRQALGSTFDRPPGNATEPEAPLEPTPRTRYLVNDGASIAYQVFGEGPDLVLIEGFATNVEMQWEHPTIARFLRRLGSFCRVVVLDKRGTGLSERFGPGEAPPLEQRADDVRAVMDAAGIDRAIVFGSSEGGSLAVLLAAAHPDRVERLILHGTWARHPWHGEPDRPEGAWVERTWGTGAVYARLAETMAATAAGRRFLGRFERQGTTPRTARRLVELMRTIDVTSVLPSIRVPTLVIHRTDDPVAGLEHAHDLVAGIPDARLVALPGRDHFLFSGDTAPLLAAVEEFVVGVSPGPPSPDRFLATVLFADIVGSTTTAADVGDARWTRELDEFSRVARRCVEEHRGELISFAGDGLLAIFDGPGRGVRAACDLRDALAPVGIEIRAGVHTAEIERRGHDVAGIGVHIASRIADVAHPGSAWVSRTVTDLVAGCGLVFEPRGEHQLRGMADPWALYEVTI